MIQTTDIKIQQDICDILAKNPGITLSKIVELLELQIGVVELHLLELEKNEAIRIVQQQGYKQFYLNQTNLGIQQKRTHQVQETIFILIQNNPGLHFSKIAELLNLRLSLAEYHLQQMEQKKKIISVKDVGYYKRYYIAGNDPGIEERKQVSILREKIPLKIVLYLLKNPNARHKDILKVFHITSSTLSYHLNKLVDNGIIVFPDIVSETGYCVRDVKEILRLLKKYRLIPLTESFDNVWDDLKFK